MLQFVFAAWATEEALERMRLMHAMRRGPAVGPGPNDRENNVMWIISDGAAKCDEVNEWRQ
jgi:hypothetical protein